MIVQYCSDLHLEFPENEKYIMANPLKPIGKILLLAGDIVPFVVMKKHEWFFDFVSAHFEHTYWIPGNHEYYYDDAADRSGAMNEKIRDNVSLVNNYACTEKGVRFIFSTLWSRIGPVNQWTIERSMADFQVINYQRRRFTALEYNRLHEESMSFLGEELQKNTESKTVVVSHHVPTFQNYPDKYRGSILNEAFAVELGDLIEPSGIDYWIYGHHHQPIPKFKIGSTELITNQLGYVRQKEHIGFKTDETVQL